MELEPKEKAQKERSSKLTYTSRQYIYPSAIQTTARRNFSPNKFKPGTRDINSTTRGREDDLDGERNRTVRNRDRNAESRGIDSRNKDVAGKRNVQGVHIALAIEESDVDNRGTAERPVPQKCLSELNWRTVDGRGCRNNESDEMRAPGRRCARACSKVGDMESCLCRLFAKHSTPMRPNSLFSHFRCEVL